MEFKETEESLKQFSEATSVLLQQTKNLSLLLPYLKEINKVYKKVINGITPVLNFLKEMIEETQKTENYSFENFESLIKSQKELVEPKFNIYKRDSIVNFNIKALRHSKQSISQTEKFEKLERQFQLISNEKNALLKRLEELDQMEKSLEQTHLIAFEFDSLYHILDSLREDYFFFIENFLSKKVSKSFISDLVFNSFSKILLSYSPVVNSETKTLSNRAKNYLPKLKMDIERDLKLILSQDQIEKLSEQVKILSGETGESTENKKN